MKKNSIFVIIFLFSLISIAQQSNIKFNYLTIKDGLSQSDVITILQDSRGLMWFGTQDGLNVYNGFDFNVFSHDFADSNSISNNYIRDLLEDSLGNIWIATENGLNLFNRNNYNFNSLINSTNQTKLKQDVWSLAQDEKYVWVGTENNLIKVNKITHEYSRVYLMLSIDVQEIKIRKLKFIENSKNLLIATEGYGVIKFNTETSETTQYYQDNSLIKSNTIWDIFQDKSGMIWIATNQGVNFYNPKTKKIASNYQIDKKIGNEIIKCIYEDNAGLIWIGTENKGVLRINSFDNIDHYTYNANISTSVSSNKINTFFEDNSGIIWIGTQSGINKFDKQKQFFKHYQNWPNIKNSINSNMVWSIYQDNNNEEKLYIGTDKGLNIINNDNGEVLNITPNFNEELKKTEDVFCIYKDHNDNLLIGTDGGVLRLTHQKTLEPLSSTIHKQNQYRTYTILEDTKNRLWLGTRQGLIIVSEDRKHCTTFRSNDKKEDLKSDIIRVILQAQDGTIWIGTDGGGLFKVIEQNNTFRFKSYTKDEDNPNSLSNNIILSILEDKNGILWIGTFGGGLNVFDPKTENFNIYTEKDGLSNNVIYGITQDKKGNLWMSTNKGITQFFVKRKTFRIFDESDGLQSNEFNTGAYYQSKSGQLFFGGINGFNAFYPEDIHINKSPAIPIITNFYLFNKPIKIGRNEILTKHISEVKEIILEHRQNVISFEFAALHYSYPLKNKHKYKLENFNEEWVEIGNSRRANYTNLDPGNYIFKVKVSNNDGIWSDQVAQVNITVKPPFWKTIWFIIVFYVCIPLLLIYAFIRYRINQVKRQKLILEIQVKERTREVIKQKELLETEKEKTEKLLLNILPAETAEELKAKGKATARQYRMTSIMFTDFKSFTKIAESIDPQILISELDNYFIKFDEIVEKYDVEKIKTIGDAYMCAGGIPIRNKSNPIDTVLAGLEIQRFVTKYNEIKRQQGEKGWSLRIGIHTGSVIAGVVGTKRFAYDIWGDSVNIASRVEAASNIGKVNISGTTYDLVKEFFTCEYRGKIRAKNKGYIDMYFVHHIRPELSENEEGIVPNELFQKYVDLHIYSSIKYRKAEKYIVNRLKKELPNNLHYHDLQHTVDVCSAVERIALMERIEGDDIFLLKTAALFHDAGFVHQYSNNEDIGSAMAREVLPRFGYTETQINVICELVQVTKVTRKPKNHLQEIICDADLDYLGGDEFHITADKLKRELFERDIVKTDKQWDELQIKFLEAHTYFTKTAKELRKANKWKRIKEIKERLKTYGKL